MVTMLPGSRVALVLLFTVSVRWIIVADAWVTSPSCSRTSRNLMVNKAGQPYKSASIGTLWPCGNNHIQDITGNSCLHSSVVSPRRADVGGRIDDENDGNREKAAKQLEEELLMHQDKLNQLSKLLETEPRDLLRFQTEDKSGLRGIYLNRSVEKDEIVLKLPVDSCLTDDRSPSWLRDQVKNDPHRWATRLAASWIELHLTQKQLDNKHETGNKSTDSNSQKENSISRGHEVWCSLLPDPEYLRASLPVHWPETTLLTARSTALELAVDSAFFARAEAVDDLVHGMQRSAHVELLLGNDEVETHRRLNELAHHALDLVQTRSCRLDEVPMIGSDGEPQNHCRRALAPIFDFINHGSRNTADANAYFALEADQQREYLVVRALQDLSRDEEVKLDYGESARPAWKCLLSYGFVPEYKRTTSDAEGGENLAEVYMKGVRYEVADDSVPMDMVADATPRPYDESDPQSNENLLTPDIALRIAERIADAAYYLLLEPEQILDNNDGKELCEEDDTDTTISQEPPFEVISKQLAASLRWSQHKILLTCAAGLTHFAKEHQNQEESSYQ